MYSPQESGLYYLQSRYYDPNTGRFINADVLISTGQGILGNNMFAYCLNNPVDYVDPTGTCANTFSIYFKVDCGKITCPTSSAYKQGNYYSFEKSDIYSEHIFVYSDIAKEDVNDWYNEISAPDYEPQSLGATTFFPMWVGLLTEMIELNKKLQSKGCIDPSGNILYIEQGYTVIELHRVYIGADYSAVEREFFVYDKNAQLVYNDTVIVSKFID